MQIGRLFVPEFSVLDAESFEGVRKPRSAGARPRSAQNRALKRGDGALVVARSEPQQRVLEQAEQRYRGEGR